VKRESGGMELELLIFLAEMDFDVAFFMRSHVGDSAEEFNLCLKWSMS
jgi:hypothetical protein